MKMVFALVIAASVAGAANAQSRDAPAPHPSLHGLDHTQAPPDMGRVRSHTGADFDRHEFDRRDGARIQDNFDAERRRQAAPWRPPDAPQYRRWNTGERLPSFSSAPKITRFGLHGLTAPPPDAAWVRSGPDALLVNRTSGEIIRVQYGVFN